MKNKKLIVGMILLSLVLQSGVYTTPALAAPLSYGSNSFIIEDGILTGYYGPGGDVVVPDGVVEIGDWSFSKHSGIKSITIPEGVTKIGAYAFAECTGLTHISLPDSLAEIDAGAFCLCTSLSSIILPEHIKIIETYAFEACYALKAVVLPNSVSVLGDGVFSESGINSFLFPPNIERSGIELFRGCRELRVVSFPVDCKTADTYSGWRAGLFGDLFIECPELMEIENIPCDGFAKILNNNRSLVGWLNPGSALTKQSDRICALASQITGGLKTDYERAEAVANWVHDYLAYDDIIEYDHYDPEAVLDAGRARCTGFAVLTEALLDAVGIPTLCVFGIASEPHMWNYIFVEDHWIWADPTWGANYFDISLIQLSATHTISMFVYESEQDTPSEWAKPEVWKAIVEKIVPNELQASYREDITRLQLCQLLMKALSEYDPDISVAWKGERPFTDTNDPAVAQAFALGVVNGVGNNLFEPDRPVTREEAAAMQCRLLHIIGIQRPSSELKYIDKATISTWASEYVCEITALGIMAGDNNMFRPKNNISIQEAICMVHRYFGMKGF